MVSHGGKERGLSVKKATEFPTNSTKLHLIHMKVNQKESDKQRTFLSFTKEPSINSMKAVISDGLALQSHSTASNF